MPERANYDRMKAALARVRDENILSKPPIDPREIAENYALTVREVEFQPEHANVCGFFDFATNTIYVNGRHPFNRKTFTVAHELGHFIMHNEIYKREPSRYQVLLRMPIGAERDPLEKEANAFAAHLLVPREALAEVYPYGSNEDLAAYFMVSQDVIRARIEFEQNWLLSEARKNGHSPTSR